MSGFEKAVGLYTIVYKEARRIMRIWVQTVVPPAITMALYFIIFGQLRERIGSMSGYDYTQYIAPGLILMSVITNSYGNVVSSFFGAKFQRHLEEMLVSPLPNYIIVLGHAAGGVLRGLIVGVIVFLVAMAFTSIEVRYPLIVAFTLLCTAITFSLGGMINAIFAKKFDDISLIPAFVLTPLTYLGGVFYSVDLLPGVWRTLSLFNPILYMINAFRYGMIGASDVSLGIAYAMMGVFVLLLFGVCAFLIHRGIGIRD
ncbi:MAG: ABC transporter permease [Gammaproteobacteria bacterium]|nr:ABC transporter permease [Gammaproteobacteria bacterium]MCY4166007.1 ABC transporter permease [Gammaproteobacteria bacterium]MCY4256383.1 ABC transporter permease [Gammaproteobacteria bacterium]MCY4341207.1 ABC transporter permease [Gammaproteobacteria bacterium]